MNGYDIFLLALVAVSIVMGLVKGLVREVFSLAGVILGVVISLIASPHLSETLGRVIPFETAAYAASFLILFCATLFVMSLAGALLTKLLDLAQLGLPNRLLGGLFGLVRGFLTVIVITLGLTLFLEEDSATLAESRIVPHIAFGTRLLAPLLPHGVEEVLIHRLKDLPKDPRSA